MLCHHRPLLLEKMVNILYYEKSMMSVLCLMCIFASKCKDATMMLRTEAVCVCLPAAKTTSVSFYFITSAQLVLLSLRTCIVTLSVTFIWNRVINCVMFLQSHRGLRRLRLLHHAEYVLWYLNNVHTPPTHSKFINNSQENNQLCWRRHLNGPYLRCLCYSG